VVDGTERNAGTGNGKGDRAERERVVTQTQAQMGCEWRHGSGTAMLTHPAQPEYVIMSYRPKHSNLEMDDFDVFPE
jgi:hypothetical protein